LFDLENLQLDRSLCQLVEAVTPLLVLDGECVDSCADYEPVLRALDDLLGGALRIREARYQDGPTRTIVLTRDDRPPITLTLEGDTDWLDHDNLVTQLDAALDAEDAPLRLVAVWSEDLLQCIAFAALPAGQLAPLAELVAWRTEYERFDQLSPAGRPLA
jgi:hypothetical protein